MKNISGKIISAILFSLSLFGVLAAAGGIGGIETAFVCLYDSMKGILAVGLLLLVVLAAIIYAIGQTMGAETRARATVWATAMFTGSIIGAIIFVLVPYLLGVIVPDLIDPATGKPAGDAELNCPDQP